MHSMAFLLFFSLYQIMFLYPLLDRGRRYLCDAANLRVRFLGGLASIIIYMYLMRSFGNQLCFVQWLQYPFVYRFRSDICIAENLFKTTRFGIWLESVKVHFALLIMFKSDRSDDDSKVSRNSNRKRKTKRLLDIRTLLQQDQRRKKTPTSTRKLSSSIVWIRLITTEEKPNFLRPERQTFFPNPCLFSLGTQKKLPFMCGNSENRTYENHFIPLFDQDTRSGTLLAAGQVYSPRLCFWLSFMGVETRGCPCEWPLVKEAWRWPPLRLSEPTSCLPVSFQSARFSMCYKSFSFITYHRNNSSHSPTGPHSPPDARLPCASLLRCH